MKKPGRTLPRELCLEMVEAMPLAAKIKLCENLEANGKTITDRSPAFLQYIQRNVSKYERLNLPITPTLINYWDSENCVNLSLSDGKLTITHPAEEDDGDEDGGCVRAKFPIPQNADGIFYFEIFVKEGNATALFIGLRIRPIRAGSHQQDGYCGVFSSGFFFWRSQRMNMGHGLASATGSAAASIWPPAICFSRETAHFWELRLRCRHLASPPMCSRPIEYFWNNDGVIETNFGRKPFKWQCSEADLERMIRGDGPRMEPIADSVGLAEAWSRMKRKWNRGNWCSLL